MMGLEEKLRLAMGVYVTSSVLTIKINILKISNSSSSASSADF